MDRRGRLRILSPALSASARRPGQLEFEGIAPAGSVFRPIHYLGSKLRLIPAIRNAIEAVAMPGPLCDLFAGSGTVALAMSHTRSVIALDIQEYSRVLCSALLTPPDDRLSVGAAVLERSRDSGLLERLTVALAPVIAYESECIRHAIDGDAEPLCDFIEHGSLVLFAHGGARAGSRKLRAALRAATRRLDDAGLGDAPASLVTRHFGGAYFSFAQAAALDALLDAAHALPPPHRDAGIAPVLSTASDTVNTVGKHFAQPIRPRDGSGKPKTSLVTRVIKDRRLDVFVSYRAFVDRYDSAKPGAGCHRASKDDYAEFLRTYSGPVGVFYADPPYTRDHYSRFYHVLETMCLRDDPKISQSFPRGGTQLGMSRGVYRSDRHQSPFCIKSQAGPAFSQLFSGARRFGVPLVLSYSPFEKDNGARPRMMNIEGIVTLAREHFRAVEVQSAGRFAHSKLNLQGRHAPVNEHAEVLIVCRP